MTFAAAAVHSGQKCLYNACQVSMFPDPDSYNTSESEQ